MIDLRAKVLAALEDGRLTGQRLYVDSGKGCMREQVAVAL